MTLANAKRLLQHYEETNQKDRAEEIRKRYSELSPKPAPKPTSKKAKSEEKE